MRDKVKDLLLSEGVERGTDITVALSGGADSVSLLLALCELKDELGLKIHAAHLNHCLRGDEADADEQFCRELCDELGVPFVSEKADVKAVAKSGRMSIELAARQVRYEFLERCGTGLIATAHTADDNLETVIYDLSRGTGLAGLCGIPVRRDRFIRPLINCTRAEIEDFLAERGRDYRTDSTNSDDAYRRNFIRHKIVPLIKQLNPNAAASVRGTCEGLVADNDFLEGEAKRCAARIRGENGFDLGGLKELPDAVLSRIIIREYRDTAGISPDRRTVKAVLAAVSAGEGKIAGEGGAFAEIRKGELCFHRPPAVIESTVLPKDFSDFSFGGYVFSRRSEKDFAKSAKVHNLLLFAALDCDKIIGTVTVRPRQEGDRFRPAGRGCAKTLRKFFNETGVPAWLRGEIPVICDEKGIIAVGTLAVDERVRVTEKTGNLLIIEGGKNGGHEQ